MTGSQRLWYSWRFLRQTLNSASSDSRQLITLSEWVAREESMLLNMISDLFTSKSCESYHACSPCNAIGTTWWIFFFSAFFILFFLWKILDLSVLNHPLLSLLPWSTKCQSRWPYTEVNHILPFPHLLHREEHLSDAGWVLGCWSYCSGASVHPEVWLWFCTTCYILIFNSIYSICIYSRK